VDFPIFGHNIGVASAVQTAQLPAPGGAASIAPSDTNPQAAAKSSAPSGFLELARQIQSQGDANGSTGSGHGSGKGLFGEDGFGFDDVIDAINPLQNIPIVSTIYRAITGDKIDVGPRLVGGALYGGFFGFIGAAINAAIEDSTGHDIGDNVRLALFGAPDETEREPVMFAGNQGATPSAAVADAAATAPNAETATADAATDTPTLSPASGPNLPSGPKDGKMPALTAAQLSLLQERESQDAASAPAADSPAPAPTSPAAAAAPAEGNVIDLTPEQEALLLKSVGLSPPEKSGTAPQAATPPAAPPAQAAAPAPQADAGNDASDDSEQDSAAPKPSAAAPANGRAALPVQSDFAKRMQTGLDRYYAHRTPINTQPPHLDVIR
jgi:hypothetical protein